MFRIVGGTDCSVDNGGGRMAPLPPPADRQIIVAAVDDAIAKRRGGPLEKSESVIGTNERRRKERRMAWYRASAKVDIWRARLDMHSAVARAQDHCLPEVRGVPKVDWLDRLEMVEAWRAAKIEQLLTPAPTMALLQWKRRVFEGLSDYDFVGATPAQIERALVKDEAWLSAHPTRVCKSNKARRGVKGGDDL